MWMNSFLKTLQLESSSAIPGFPQLLLFTPSFFPLPVAKWRLLVAFLPSSTWCVRKHTAAISMQTHSVLDSSLSSSHPRCFKVQSSVFPVSLCSLLSLPPPFFCPTSDCTENWVHYFLSSSALSLAVFTFPPMLHLFSLSFFSRSSDKTQVLLPLPFLSFCFLFSFFYCLNNSTRLSFSIFFLLCVV